MFSNGSLCNNKIVAKSAPTGHTPIEYRRLTKTSKGFKYMDTKMF